MKPSDVSKTIELAHAIRRPLMVWGSPGVCKSSLYHQYAKRKKLALIDWRLTLMDSVDMRGTPHRDKDGFTVWAPPGELPRNGSGILLLDELPQARMEVKNVAAMLTLENRIGEWKLPEGWWVAAAGNRMGEGAGTSPMPTQLNNRFWHVDCDVSVSDWLEWAAANDVDYRVQAFIKYQEGALMGFDPKSKDAAFNTPRSWVDGVSNILKQLGTERDILAMEPAILSEMMAGNVGKVYGESFVGFLRVMHELVKFEEILKDPNSAQTPTEPSVCYAVVTGLTRVVEKSNVANAFKYVVRMSKEYAFVFARKLELEQPALRKTAAFTNFCAENADFI